MRRSAGGFCGERPGELLAHGGWHQPHPIPGDTGSQRTSLELQSKGEKFIGGDGGVQGHTRQDASEHGGSEGQSVGPWRRGLQEAGSGRWRPTSWRLGDRLGRGRWPHGQWRGLSLRHSSQKRDRAR